MNDAKLKFLVGIDWASEAHEVCVLNAEGERHSTRSVKHQADALNDFAASLLRLSDGNPASIGIAIERPDGPLVETLVEHGFSVYAINPKQLDRFRDRHTVSGAKDDRRDAYVLADSLRTDRPLYRLVQPDAPEIIQLRAASRLHADLTGQFVACTNKLRDQLHRFYPQALQLKADDESWFWNLLELAPTPEAAKKLRPAAVARLLKSHRIRRFDAATVIDTLRATPVTVARGVPEAASFQVASLIRQLRLLRDEKARCAEVLEQIVESITSLRPPTESRSGQGKTSKAEPTEGQRSEHRDVEIIRSLPGVGINVVATMLAEASQPLADRDYASLRIRCGSAPVTFQTGKQKQRGGGKRKHRAPPPKVVMRHACNHWLRNAIYYMVQTAIGCDEHWGALYEDARQRGAKHGAAVRLVGDRMLDTLISMLRHGTKYDAAFRRPKGTNIAA